MKGKKGEVKEKVWNVRVGEQLDAMVTEISKKVDGDNKSDTIRRLVKNSIQWQMIMKGDIDVKPWVKPLLAKAALSKEKEEA